MNANLVIIAALALAPPTLAHQNETPWPGSAVICLGSSTSTVLVKTKVSEFRSGCFVKVGLNRVDFYYPKMNMELTVNAWVGGYARKALVENFFKTTTYACNSSDPLKVEYWSDGPHEEDVVFQVANPNLDKDIRFSFVANAPMTDGELEQALIQVKMDCEKARANVTTNF